MLKTTGMRFHESVYLAYPLHSLAPKAGQCSFMVFYKYLLKSGRKEKRDIIKY